MHQTRPPLQLPLWQNFAVSDPDFRCSYPTCPPPRLWVTYGASTLAYGRRTNIIITKNPQGSHPQYFLKSMYTVKNTCFWREINKLRKLKKKKKANQKQAVRGLHSNTAGSVKRGEGGTHNRTRHSVSPVGAELRVSHRKVPQHRQHSTAPAPSFPTKPEIMAFPTVPYEKNTWTLLTSFRNRNLNFSKT